MTVICFMNPYRQKDNLSLLDKAFKFINKIADILISHIK